MRGGIRGGALGAALPTLCPGVLKAMSSDAYLSAHICFIVAT
jgi:hypothetical protein